MKAGWARILSAGLLIFFFCTSFISSYNDFSFKRQAYQEDFEDGVAQGWELDEGWQVMEEDGNTFLLGQGHNWARANHGENDYRLSFKLKLIKGDIHLVYRLNNEGRYYINFNGSGSQLNKQLWPDDFRQNLTKTYHSHQTRVWHEIEIIGEGDTISFNINGENEWTYTDPKPLTFGSFAFETLQSSEAAIDDISLSVKGKPVETTDDFDFNELIWTHTGGPLGGLGYDVRMDPNKPEKMFVTDAYAGIFMSLDGGQTWFPSNEGISARQGATGDIIPIFCATIDPNNTDIVWTGFQNNRGIFKSTDGGFTWQQMTNGIIENEGISFRGFTVEPGNSDIVYAAAEIASWSSGREPKQGLEFDMVTGVVYKTTNGGENWKPIWRGDNLARYIWIDPMNTNVLYVSTGIFDREANNSNPEFKDSGGVGIIKSYDGGVTWEQVNNGLNNLYVGTLFMHPSNPNILLAGTGNNQYSQSAGAYLSLDGGATWKQVIENEIIASVEFSTTEPNIAYAGSSNKIFRSEDGGQNWELVSGDEMHGWGMPGVRAGFPIDFQVDPRDPNRIFANNYGGGNFLSEDGGRTWINASRGYTGAQIRDIVVDPNNPARVFSVARSGIFMSLDGGLNWQGIGNPPVTVLEWNAVDINPSDSNQIIAGTNWDNRIAISDDSGETWEVLHHLPDFFGLRTVKFAPSDPRIIYAGSAGYFSAGSFDDRRPGMGLFKSTNNGLSWQEANDSLSEEAAIARLAIHPNNPDILYAASVNTGLLFSKNGGDSWEKLGGGLPESSATSVMIKPKDPQLLLAGFYGQAIYSSTDGGNTWQRSSVGMPPEASIMDIAFDPTQPQNVIYAADFFSGVYRSSDGGKTWRMINNGLMMRSVTSLSMSSDGKHLYAGTDGGGVYRLDLDGHPPQPVVVLEAEIPSPTAEPTVKPSDSTPEPTTETIEEVSVEEKDSRPSLWIDVGSVALVLSIALFLVVSSVIKKK